MCQGCDQSDGDVMMKCSAGQDVGSLLHPVARRGASVSLARGAAGLCCGHVPADSRARLAVWRAGLCQARGQERRGAAAAGASPPLACCRRRVLRLLLGCAEAARTLQARCAQGAGGAGRGGGARSWRRAGSGPRTGARSSGCPSDKSAPVSDWPWRAPCRPARTQFSTPDACRM